MNCKFLHQDLLTERPQFQRFGLTGESSTRQKLSSRLARSATARFLIKGRRHYAAHLSIQASSWRLYAIYEIGSTIREDKVEDSFGIQARVASPNNSSVDGDLDTPQKLQEEDLNTNEGIEDTDEGTALGTGSGESIRKRRARLTQLLFEQGTSPIEILESLDGWRPDIFWTLVNILYVNSRAPEALLLFEWWKRQEWYSAEEPYYTKFISVCGHAKMLDSAQELFDEMIRLGIQPTVATYTCLLQGFAEAGDFDKANEILKQMISVGTIPNAITYTGLLHAYGKHGYYTEMAKMFNTMKTYQIKYPECSPTSVTYSALLQWYAKGGLFGRMEKALKEMTAKDLQPDGVAVNAMVQGYASAGLVKEMEKAYCLVRPYKVAVYLETVRAVASAYIRRSYFFQLGSFARYHSRRRVKMGKLIQNLLLLSHAANFSMRALADEYVALTEAGFEGDITSFNIRALAFSRMQMFWDLHVTVLEMVQQGVLPDLVTYGAVVDAYVAGNLQAKLPEALGEMTNLDRLAKTQTDELVFEAFGRGEFQVCSEELVQDQAIDERFLTYANLVGYYLKKTEILSSRRERKKFSRL